MRDIVIVRGCLLLVVFDFSGCNGFAKEGQLILQGDHLIMRANSATYADTRLIMCLCQEHHGWKSLRVTLSMLRSRLQLSAFVSWTVTPASMLLKARQVSCPIPENSDT